MANVLVVGNGGREHALAWKFRQSSEVAKVFTAPSNATDFSCNEISNLDDIETIKAFCVYNKIDLVVLGPEKPICQGWTEKLGLTTKVFGPSGSASIIESSKSFSKTFMKRNEIPTANFETFNSFDSAKNFIEKFVFFKIKTNPGICSSSCSKFVVKEDGLRAGKGVFILDSIEEAKSKLEKLTISSEFPIIIEEFLEGYEISALCFTDGTNIEMMPFSQDHKRIFDGDKGENTGGMGAIAPIYLSKKLEVEIQTILQKTVDCLKTENLEYKGVLYAGLMITEDGPKVLEYNCRFGDPETQILMRLLDSDLYLICRACCDGDLSKVAVHWTNKAVIGVVLASKGYPGTFEIGKIISGIPKNDENVITFFARIKKSDSGKLVNSGGRVLCVTSIGKSFHEAKAMAYKTIEEIQFDLAFFRNDIGNFIFAKKKGFSYKSAGVNITEGNELVKKIKDVCQKTRIPGTDEIGGFGALIDLKAAGFQDPILVLGMDGIGTKIEVATKMKKYESLGFDLVGMCANDVVCHGAAPVAFLDYYVTGKLNKDQAAEVISSIAEACRDCNCAIVGGETAEMPGVYGPNQWDLAGCCVGVHERSWGAFPKLNEIKEGDVIIGLSSSGLHSNGFSLVRAIFVKNGIDLNDPCPWDKNITFGDELLKPTKIYVNKIIPLVKRGMIKAAAHITGGGLIENVPRILPAHLAAKINCHSWQMPEIFMFLQELGHLESLELFRTFNCGIGMVIVVDNLIAGEVFQKLGTVESIARIGNIQKRKRDEEQVILVDPDSMIDHQNKNLRTKRANVAIFISGTGTNAINLIEQAANPRSRCNIRIVISNNPDAKGLETARKLGIEAICVPHGTNRQLFEQKLHFELVTRDVDFICLAGFMRILTPWLLEKWPNKIINIHPSLLPSFKGAHPVQDAIAAGVKITGCTAHFVTEEVDAGRILAQEAVFVDENDTEATLHAKIQQKEYLIFPKVMEIVAQQILDLDHF